MFFFLWPQLKERFGTSPPVEEAYPMVTQNYTSYPLRATLLWKKTDDRPLPIINDVPYTTYYAYQDILPFENKTNMMHVGIFVSKKSYVIIEQNDTYRKLYGPFT